MKRRGFVQRLPVLTAGLAAGASAAMMDGCASVPYLVPQPTPRGLSLPASELGPEGDACIDSPLTLERAPGWQPRPKGTGSRYPGNDPST